MTGGSAHHGADIGTAITEVVALLGAIELHGDGLTIDLADEDGLTGKPVAHHQMLAGNATLVVKECDFKTGTDHRRLDGLRPFTDLNDPFGRQLARTARQLAGDLHGTVGVDLVHVNRDGGKLGATRIGKFDTMEAIGIFLRDEARGDIARAPARMLHDRAEERNVVTDALDAELIERDRHMVDGRGAVRTMRAELGDHRIVIDRNLAAFIDACVIADREAIERAFDRRLVAHQTTR